MGIFEQLSGYLSFSFVRYALIAGVLIALCSSLLGVTLVLKRFSSSETGFPTWRLVRWQLPRFCICKIT